MFTLRPWHSHSFGFPGFSFGPNLVHGSRGADALTGSARSDIIVAGWGDDTITSGAGNDIIMGGFGRDMAVYEGSIDDYEIGQRGWWGPVTVTSLNDDVTDAGHDTLISVEKLYFKGDDYTYNLDGTNNAVLARDDVAQTTEDAPLMLNVADLLANDREFDGDEMTVTGVSGTSSSGATVTLQDGKVSYDPGALFDSLGEGETATDTFTYTVDDGKGGTDTATVTVTITGQNDAPVLNVAPQICITEGFDTVNAVISASDVDGDTLSYAITGGADADLFTINAETGALTFKSATDADAPADAGADNTYDVTITVSDGHGGSVSEDLSIKVVPAPVVETQREVVAYDMVGSQSQNLISFTTDAPDFSSRGDGFGKFKVGEGSIPFSLMDDTAGVYTRDSLGIIDSGSNSDQFFGATDTVNGDTSDDVTATWSFDISGKTELGLEIDAGAMGDFESSDAFTLSYSIDGGPEQVLITFAADESGSQTYTLASGKTVTLNDPLTANGTVLTNVLQTLTAEIEGTGSKLDIRFSGKTNGGSEALALQNLKITAAGEPVQVEGSDYAVTAQSEDTFEGNTGTTTLSFEITRSGDLSEAGSVDYTVAGDVDADDFGGTLPSGTVTFAPGQTCATVTVEVTGDKTLEADETVTLTLGNAQGGTVQTGEASVQILDDDDISLISTVQGSGAESFYKGQTVTVSAIVTKITEKGFFLQEEDADSDGNAQTSEGVFIFYRGDQTVKVGDGVALRGTVTEYYGETQIGQVEALRVLSQDNALPTATKLVLSGAEMPNFEAVEGMRVSVESGVEDTRLTVIENYNFDRYGEITISAGRQIQPTQLYDAQTEADEVAALAEANANNRLLIDDGSTKQNPDEIKYAPATVGDNGNGYIDAGDDFGPEGPTLRLGAEIDGPVEGVISYGFGKYRLQVDGQLNIDPETNEGARQDTPDEVGGDLQVASVNVLNYFTTLQGQGGSGPNELNPRGASSAEDLAIQTSKIVEMMQKTGAEVFALQEIENGGFGEGAAIDALVDAMNAADGPGGAEYAFVDPTTNAGFLGSDAITTGIIYDAAKVKLIHSEFRVYDEASAAATYAKAAVLNAVVPSSAQLGDYQRNRPSVAATFEDLETGKTFTVVSSHFKSKGDSGLVKLVNAAQTYLDNGGTEITQADIDALKADPNYDQGNGQGFWNQVRADAAGELKAWITESYNGSGTDSYLLMGDMNAYSKEDPVQTLTDGNVDLIDQFIGAEDAYSFVFSGQQGALDQAIASEDLAGSVTGVTEWHINADEPDLLNYNSRYKDPGYTASGVFAASDHDPLIVGINTTDDLIFA